MGTFKNIATNETVKIISETENQYILDSGMKMDKKLFSQKYVSNESIPTPIVEATQTATQPTPTIVDNGKVNVDDFFSKKPTIDGVENISKVDTSKLIDPPSKQPGWTPTVKNLDTDNPTTIINQGNQPELSLEQQKQILINNYNNSHQGQQQGLIGSQNVDINDDAAIQQLIDQTKQPVKQVDIDENGLTKQQEYIRQQQIELTGVDPFKDKIIKYRAQFGLNPTPATNPKPINQVVPQTQVQINGQQMTVNEEDEVIKMFKKFKRNHTISIKFSQKDKIGKPEFIQMMAEGLDGDIIQFYTDELFKKFISDIDAIKDDIYNQIYKKVYGVDKPVEIEELIEIKTNEELGITSGTEIELIPGDKTKAGKQKYKFINDKGKVVEMLVESATKKQYRPATKKDLKK